MVALELVIGIVCARRPLPVLLERLMQQFIMLGQAELLLVRCVGGGDHDLAAARFSSLAETLVQDGLDSVVRAATD